ncbi:MAG: HAMP domain-containing histidine kinase [Clostridia bacterium]|nr:HAMP domain-containing histidine kinase [Clostridia bacterium]
MTDKLRGFSFKHGGIKRRWLLNNVLVVFLVITALMVGAGFGINRYYYASVSNNLETRAKTQARYINAYVSSSYESFYEYSRRAVQNFSDADKIEMQILDGYGRVMFSSSGFTAGYLPTTQEVRRAISEGGTHTFVGEDTGINDRVVATTAAVYYRNSKIIGAVRYVSSTRAIEAQLRFIYLLIAALELLLLAIVIVTNLYFVRSIVNPIIKINELTKKIAGGQLGAKLDSTFEGEVGELCTTVNGMSDELARSEKLKNDFISSVSHELRTPLTAINGWTETIENSLDDPDTAKEGLSIVKKETARLSQMVEELLDFSRIESGRMRLNTEDFDIRGEVYDAVFTYNDLLRRENMKVNYDEGNEEILVHGDKNRLKQVFLNVLDNAAKYGNSGENIDITVKKEGDACVVRIKDYGQGIPEDELPHVKEKFFKGSAKGRGTGIGLAVSNEIISLHGGSIEIESKVGNGTEVTITLPTIQEKI